MTQPKWLTEADVVGLLSLEEALEPLEAGLRRLEEGGATIPKQMHAWPGGSLHSLGAFDPVTGLAGYKTWINTPKGAVALMSVFDADSGQLRAVIEVGSMGAMRTAGATALATRELAAPEADEVAIIGSGRQALAQLGAIALVRQIRSVRFWSPTPEKRQAAAEAARQRFGLNVVAVETLREAVGDTPIVATVTRARDPFLNLDMLARGTHLNAVGAIAPGWAELHPDVLPAADLIVADSVPGVSALREMEDAFGPYDAATPRATALSALLAGAAGKRPHEPRLTVFKSIGIGASDLAVAGEVLRRAEARGAGRSFDNPTPAPPRWRAA